VRCDLPLLWPSPGFPQHPGTSHQATEELTELRGILQQAVAELAPLLLALARHLLLHEGPQVLARHQELALRQQELGQGERLALGIALASAPDRPGRGAGCRTQPWGQPAGSPLARGSEKVAELGGTLSQNH